MKLILILLGVSLILMGCYSPRILTLMPRDTGKTYTGTMISTGNGVGNITITIDQITYSGPVVRVGSNETFGFATAFGSNSRGTSASSIGSSFSDGVLICIQN